jgi:low temperature requirement protein LtrA
MQRMTTPARSSRLTRHVHPTDEDHKVTTLELFFDLAFVFAITQVTALMADDLSGRGAFRGAVLLALLWFAWSSFAWLGNTAKADEGVLRAGLIGALAAMFVVALAIPEAFDDSPEGVSAPLVLALAYVAVRLAHIVVYLVVASGDAGLRRQLFLVLVPVSIASTLLVTGALAHHPAPWWLAALVIDYGGIYASGTAGWRLPSPAHFVERHGLIVIIAIGESIIAIGVGVSGTPLTWAVLLAASLGIAVAVCLWWLYFDVVVLVAERVLISRPVDERPRLARDSFTYLHFPMIAGIVFLALGLKKVLTYVSDAEHYDLSYALTGTPLYALYGGTVAYLLAHVLFRLNNVRSLSRSRVTAAVLLLALIPVAGTVPALAALGLLTTVLVGLVAFEAVRYAGRREQIRHAEHSH